MTIAWEIVQSQFVTATMVLGNKEISLRGSGSAKLTDPNLTIQLRLAGLPDLPKEFSLKQNYPNPFNPRTTIRYELPQESRVKLMVYNLLGQRVADLVDEMQDAGYKEVNWDASGMPSGVSSKGGYASGVYFYRLDAGSFVNTKKLILLK